MGGALIKDFWLRKEQSIRVVRDLSKNLKAAACSLLCLPIKWKAHQMADKTRVKREYFIHSAAVKGRFGWDDKDIGNLLQFRSWTLNLSVHAPLGGNRITGDVWRVSEEEVMIFTIDRDLSSQYITKTLKNNLFSCCCWSRLLASL